MAVANASASFCFDLPNSDAALAIAGAEEKNLHLLRGLTGANLVMRGLQLFVEGKTNELETAVSAIELTRPLWERGQTVSSIELRAALSSIDKGYGKAHSELNQQVIAKNQQGNLLRPRTLRQKSYVEAMEKHDLTFALGPAGTGKTFLATVLAVRMLKQRQFSRLVLTRPAVEAGERLGFLPGDLQQKVDPYLRPLYDALHALLGSEKTTSLLERGVIEVAPLAYMRGRTLDEAFVILDEAQNTTSAQMKMVLTRLGENSRMVVTGDESQIDLPKGQKSGLTEAVKILDGIEGVAVCQLTSSDVVRHPLVQKIVEAYSSIDFR